MSDSSNPMPKSSKSQAVARVEPEEDVRARVLEAAVALMAEGGLANLSMREVARRAGVSHQAPYHYFPDREAILAAIAQQGFILLEQELDRVREPESPAAGRMGRAGEAYVRFAFQHPAHFRVMFGPDFVDMTRFPSAQACGHKAFDRLIEVVQAYIDEGLAVPVSERVLVVFAWSVVHGLACLLLDGCLSFKMPEAVTEITQSQLQPGTHTLVHDVMHLFQSVAASAQRGAGEGGAGRAVRDGSDARGRGAVRDGSGARERGDVRDGSGARERGDVRDGSGARGRGDVRDGSGARERGDVRDGTRAKREVPRAAARVTRSRRKV
ncbi:WHG domain-containing protein [Pendulispora albinea]|uniref:WHG domain-containing protein n=1 Tax=Pendulispora albinea TaxID=2741071 RepID=A0ABZ2LNC0_9BACT